MVILYPRAFWTNLYLTALVGIILLRDGQATILGQGEQRHQLKGRARLNAAREGVVLLLVIDTALGCRLAEVYHSQYIACLDVHNHRRTPRCALLGELLAQGGVGGVLDIHIDCSHHVHTVAGNNIRVAMYGSREARRDALAQHTAILSAQVVGIYILQTILSAGALLILLADVLRNTAQRAAAKLSVGIYALVEDMFLEGNTHIAVQDGVLAQRLPLVEVHRAGQNLHGVVVTHGGIDLENLHIVATQVIHNPRYEVATASYQRVVRIYPLTMLLALLKHQTAVVSRRTVLEKGREQLR